MNQTAKDFTVTIMTETGGASRYSIVVTRHRGVYELCIRELLLTVRAATLQEGYARLLERQRQMVDLARSLDALDDLPSPTEPPIMTSVLR